MKYKGYGVYLKDRKRPTGKVYREYRIVPPAGTDWPDHIPKSGPALRTDRITVEHCQREIDRVAERQYNLDVGRAVLNLDPIDGHFKTYQEWGRTHGGKKKTGWAVKTQKGAATELAAWKAALNLKTVADIKLIPFERRVAKLLDSGLRSLTVENKSRYLTGFCKYAKHRNLMPVNPLEGWGGLDTTRRERHGGLQGAEIRQLLQAVTLKRKIIYGLAYFCRMRRGAIKSLKVKSMDWVRGGAMADYLDIKSRDAKKCFVPIPQPLLGWIWEASMGRGPEETLTSISKNHAIKYFRRDMKRAKLPLVGPDGLDRTFHGLGASTATNLENLGVSEFAIADVQGHSNLNTTRVYLRERERRIRSAQLPLVLEVYPELGQSPDKQGNENWHHLGTTEGAEMQAVELKGSYLGRDGGIRTRFPATDNSQKSDVKPRKTKSLRFKPNRGPSGTTEKITVETGQKILAQVWHRLADPDWVEFLERTLRLSPSQLRALAASIEADRKTGAA